MNAPVTTAVKAGVPALILAALSTQFLAAVGFGLLVPVLPFFVQQLGASPGLVPQVVATYALAGVLANPLLGPLSDRLGRKPVIVAALTLTAVSYAGLLAAHALWAVFVCRALAGAASGNFGVLTALVIDRARAEDRARFVGWLGAVNGIGIALGPPLGGLLVQLPLPGFEPLHLVMAGALALALVTLAFVALVVPATPPLAVAGHTARALGGAGAALLQSIAPLLWLNFGVFVAFGVIFSSSAIYVERVFGWGPVEAGYAIGAMTACVALVRLGVAHRLIARFSAKRTFAATSLAFAVSLSVSALVRDWRLFVPFYCIAGACYSAAALCLTMLLSDRTPPERRGAVMGWSGSVGSIGITVSAAASGYLFEAVSPAAPFHAAAALLAASCWLFRRA